ncbi:MAG: Gfo/Idh/MocA family oxidoreductase [Deltaproteobacteria bacterium]|nr:Gfo/Idh/MocA family oxidoreductase [Deltaproteobacteria bacterium]
MKAIRPEEKIRFGLIGCGVIANKHMTALGRISEAEVAGVYDLDPKALNEFARKYPVRTYCDIDLMIKEADPHVLVILTPSGLHANNVMELIRFNRHFVVEKPLALRLEQIDSILEECDGRGLKIFVVQQNRFNPPIRKVKEALEKGRFGKLVMGSVRVKWCRDQSYYNQKPWRGTWALDGGVLTNQASHHIDMLIWMMGEVESVMAKTASRLVNIEAEDTGVAVLKFRNGALGVIEATTATRPKDLEGSIGILGEKGTVEVGGFFMNELKVWSFSEPDGTEKEVWDRFSSVPEGAAWNHTEFFQDVIASLKSNRKGLIDGLEGRKSVELINAIYESAETGKEVFLRFTPKRCRLGVNNDK